MAIDPAPPPEPAADLLPDVFLRCAPEVCAELVRGLVHHTHARDPAARVVVITSRAGVGPAAIACAYGGLPSCDVVHVWEDGLGEVYEASKRRFPALMVFEDLAEIVDALKATGGETKTEGAAGLTVLRLLAGQFLFSGANLAPHEVSAARRPGRPLDIIKRPADPSTA